MIQIRPGSFETNSSSTHALIMCTKGEYDKLKNNELLITDDSDLVTYEEAIQYTKEYVMKYGREDDKDFINHLEDHTKQEVYEFMNEHYCAYLLEDWLDNDYYETFENSYKTPNGENIIAFGYYGYG